MSHRKPRKLAIPKSSLCLVELDHTPHTHSPLNISSLANSARRQNERLFATEAQQLQPHQSVDDTLAPTYRTHCASRVRSIISGTISMKRFFTILQSQLKGSSISETLKFAKTSLFRNDAILVFEYDHSSSNRRLPDVPAQISIRRGRIDELSRNLDRFSSVPWEFQCHLYDRVTDFFVAVSDTRGIQHIIWIYYQNDPNRVVKLGPEHAEIKYGLTLPEFRGQGIFPHALRAIVSYLSAKKIHRIFTCVNASNRSSIRGMEKAGFRQIGRTRLIKIMGMQLSKRYEP